VLLAAILSLVSASSAAWGGVITFSFDQVGSVAGLKDGQNSAAIETYMNAVLAQAGYPLASVDVKGAVADNNYKADNHLVGPKTNGTVTPLALWNTDGSHTGNTDPSKWHLGTTDTYIMNKAGLTTISMDFTGIGIVGVTFDFQIFPDGTCPNPTSANLGVNKGCTSTAHVNWPDFSFWADGTQLWLVDGVLPGADGTYHFSPLRPNNGGEKAPQLLSTSGYVDLGDITSQLLFVDWPAHIGVDNLTIYTEVPEAGTLLTFAVGVFITLRCRRRRRV
jgi:hypothetical protein